MNPSPNAILDHLDALVHHASEREGRRAFTGLEVMSMARKAIRHASEETATEPVRFFDELPEYGG